MSAAPEGLDGPGAAALHGRPVRTAVPRFGHGSRVPGWDEAADLEKDPAGIPDPDSVEVPEALRAEIEAHMANYPDRRSATLPALAAAQRLHGWCSPQALEQVACVMRVTPAYLESVASFYDMLETEPAGLHSVYVCTNISCSLRGADALHEALARAAEGERDVNVRAFECLGACDIAPMASVDGIYIGPLAPEDVPALLADIRAGRAPLPERQLARRLVADPRANSHEYPEHPAEQSLRAAPGTAHEPGRAAAGPQMQGDRPGPTAALEPQAEIEEGSS